MRLIHLERPAAGDAAGPLILHHCRGDERDLLRLAAANDPSRSMATPIAQPN